MTDGPLAFLQELTTLVNRHAAAASCSTPNLNQHIKLIMQNSYDNTFNHIVGCEVSRATGIAFTGSNELEFSTDKLLLSITMTTLRWRITCPPGITINLNKAMDEVSSDAALEPHITAMVAMNSSGSDPDLLDYAQVRIAYVVQLFALASAKMAELEEAITASITEEVSNGE